MYNLTRPAASPGRQQLPLRVPAGGAHVDGVGALAPHPHRTPAHRAVVGGPGELPDGLRVAEGPTHRGVPEQDLQLRGVGSDVLAVRGPVQVGHVALVTHTPTQAVKLTASLLHLNSKVKLI